MALNNLFGTKTDGVKLFEIRAPRFILLRGNADDASDAEISGTVVLCLTQPLTYKSVRFTFDGVSRLTHLDVTGHFTPSRSRIAKEKRTLIEETWTFADAEKTGSDTIQPGNYEWPFRQIIKGSDPESVEGLRDSWVVYRMKAVIERPYLAQAITAHKALRVVRTPSPLDLESSFERAVSSSWTGKIDYRFTIGSQYQIFGSSVRVDLHMIPLAKNMAFDGVKISITESQKFKKFGQSYQTKRDIAIQNFNVDGGPQMLNEDGQEGWHVPCIVTLPRSLMSCLQDIDIPGLTVTHKVRIVLDIRNPDGHISQVIATLPIKIYISPSYMVDDQNLLRGHVPSNEEIQEQLANESAGPPPYESRDADQLWDGNSFSMSNPSIRATNAATSPSYTRNASFENLDSVANINSDGLSDEGRAISPQILSSRLQTIQQRAQQDANSSMGSRSSTSPPPLADDLSSPPTSPPLIHSTPGSGRISRSNSLQNVRHEEFARVAALFRDASFVRGTLSKVPSYKTARESTPPQRSGADLPDYRTATTPSRPS